MLVAHGPAHRSHLPMLASRTQEGPWRPIAASTQPRRPIPAAMESLGITQTMHRVSEALAAAILELIG